MANNLVMWAQDALLPPKIFPESRGYGPLMNSGFDTLVVASFHIHPDGTLWWNSHKMVDVSELTGPIVQPTCLALRISLDDLRKNGGFKNVILSIGGGGKLADNNKIVPDHSVSDEDFMAFYANAYGNVYKAGSSNLSAMPLQVITAAVEALGASGIDVDTEKYFFTYSQLASAAVFMSELALEKNWQLTWSPYEEQSFWELLWKLMRLDRQENLTWANIQPYAWNGSPARLQSWAGSFQLQIDQIVPGFDDQTSEVSLKKIQNDLAECINQGVKVTGAYFWFYEMIFNRGQSYTPTDVANAMTNGLKGISA